MARLTETRAIRAKLPEQGQTFLRCTEVVGFAVRLTPGARTYVVHVQYAGKKMRLSLGPVGTLPFEGPPEKPGARDLALTALNAARRGEDPRLAITAAQTGRSPTLNDIWKAYKEAGFPKLNGVGRKRATTIRADRNRYLHTVEGSLGRDTLDAIDTARVRRWLDKIETEGQRSHSLALVRSLLSFAKSRGIAKTHEIAISAGRSREVQNFYKPEELTKLDKAAAELAVEKPAHALAYAAIRLLIATGARLSEILSLRWDAVEISLGVLHLERDKTSENRRDILLTPVAVETLKVLPRTSSPFVFATSGPSGHYRDVQKHWLAVIERAGVRRLRKHDLRHSFASMGIRQGVPLYTVGKLLGHRQASTTQRYSHLEQEVAREALERIAKALESPK